MGEKSQGQIVLEALEGWISSWISFPDAPAGQALVAALWVLHTWFSAKWPATAYIHITSDGPGCGKTTLMEVLASLSRAPRLRATLRPLAVVRDIADHPDGVTYFFDQVEALQASGKVSDEQSILLTGYRFGGEHGISVGSKQVAFSTYCAKCFASIGDVAPDLRSRAIVFRLSYGEAARSWTDAAMVRKGEADQLLRAMDRVFAGRPVPTWTVPDWLKGREREIFTPLWSIASALHLDAAMLKRVRRAFDDFSTFKRTVERRTYKDLIGAETPDEDREWAELALRHLAAVLPAPSKTATGDIHTAVAIEAMRDLDGPWRSFQGRGLNADVLAKLVSRFGVEANKEVRMERGRKGRVLKGYSGAQVRAALVRLASSESKGGEV